MYRFFYIALTCARSAVVPVQSLAEDMQGPSALDIGHRPLLAYCQIEEEDLGGYPGEF
jgi:hypothetical protein